MSAWRRWDLVREGGTGARVSGLAQAQLFLAVEFVRLVLRNLQFYRRVLSGVPSGSGGYVGVGNTVWMMIKM